MKDMLIKKWLTFSLILAANAVVWKLAGLEDALVLSTLALFIWAVVFGGSPTLSELRHEATTIWTVETRLTVGIVFVQSLIAWIVLGHSLFSGLVVGWLIVSGFLAGASVGRDVGKC